MVTSLVKCLYVQQAFPISAILVIYNRLARSKGLRAFNSDCNCNRRNSQPFKGRDVSEDDDDDEDEEDDDEDGRVEGGERDDDCDAGEVEGDGDGEVEERFDGDDVNEECDEE